MKYQSEVPDQLTMLIVVNPPKGLRCLDSNPPRKKTVKTSIIESSFKKRFIKEYNILIDSQGDFWIWEKR
jgi:hypothetical protein